MISFVAKFSLNSFCDRYAMADLNALSDAELLTLLKDSDRDAFAAIYERYFSALYLHAYNRLRDNGEAKDMVQELFAQLWEKRETGDLKTNLSNYLYTAVRNRVLNALAHQQVRSKYFQSLLLVVDPSQSITDHRARERQLAAIIEKEVQALPPKMREVFELSRKANLTYKEIAGALDITEQSVRSHVKGALKILRVKLGILVYIAFLFYR